MNETLKWLTYTIIRLYKSNKIYLKCYELDFCYNSKFTILQNDISSKLVTIITIWSMNLKKSKINVVPARMRTVLNVMNLYQTNRIYVIVFGNNTSLVMVVEGGGGCLLFDNRNLWRFNASITYTSTCCGLGTMISVLDYL